MKDVKLDAAHKVASSARSARKPDVAFADAAETFGITHDDFSVPLPGKIAAVLNDIQGTPTGSFSGRTAAESRAFALDRKLPQGTSIFAQKVGDHWCVIKSCNGLRVILEG